MLDIATVEPQYGRVKGASWFPLLYRKDVMVLGQGGIGSWVTLLLSRIGCSLHIFDMDNYEDHNMTGQVVSHDCIGLNKARAMQRVVNNFSPTCLITHYPERYTEDSFGGNIMICGFDNMEARKVAFKNWMAMLVPLTPEQRANCFFQDGRLLAEQLQIINIPGDDMKRMDKYEQEYLFSDEEVQEAECTFKQTSHCAAMIASHMVGFLTNWASNADRKSRGEPGFRAVPFFYEYLIPANYVS
jgi:hypothetical protein